MRGGGGFPTPSLFVQTYIAFYRRSVCPYGKYDWLLDRGRKKPSHGARQEISVH